VITENDLDEECESCGYSAPLTTYPNINPELAGPFKFCDVCAYTFLCRAVTYPRQYGSRCPLWASIGYIANMILDELRQIRAATETPRDE
jgi:hypothetical protein